MISRGLPLTVLLAVCFIPGSLVYGQDIVVEACHGQSEVGDNPQKYQPANPHQSYPVGSWVRTGDNSSITIAFDPKNRFRLLYNSEAQATGPDKLGTVWHRVLELKLGVAEIEHDASTHLKLECETPSSICGAEGTQFKVDASQGIFTVSEGKITVSSSQEKALSLTAVTSGGTLIYTPGSENMWCDWSRTNGAGNFSGVVHLGSFSLPAVGADFTIAKVLSDNLYTAIKIKAGTVGGYGPGMYLVDNAKLVAVPAGSNAATVFGKYLKAAKKESALAVQKAAYHAAHRPLPPGLNSDLVSASLAANQLRHALFDGP